MAVQVWVGEKPEHSNERRAIMALANGLQRLDGLYLILANFSVGGRNVDLVVIKQDGIFIIELKHCDGKIFGDVNGPWFVEGSNGERKRLNPGRKNPYNQVISYYYSLINFLNDRRSEFLPAQKATAVDFRTCRRVVVIAPTIQEGSKVETDWKVELKGLDELPAYLVTERSGEIDLIEEEMLRIPELLHLTRWSEINTLLAGVVPNIDALSETATLPPPPPVIAPPPGPVPTPAPAAEAAPGLASRAKGALGTWNGPAMAVLSVLVLVLVSALLSRSTGTPLVADQPAPAILVSTSPPAGGEVAYYQQLESCVWSGFQAVGRRRGTQEDAWENVGVVGAAPAFTPDVVVTLEEVDFCDDQIVLNWSVRNNLSDDDVELPLTADNISVSDSLGNDYPIAEDRSQPPMIAVPPGGKAEGRTVISRAVNLNAPTLVIRLRDQPFGEARWLVPIGG